MARLGDLSVIIVTYHGDSLLANCLESLFKVYGEAASGMEIVVVDNGNNDSTRDLCGKYGGVKYLAAPDNLGFAGGNNLGLTVATKGHILLLNNDTIIHGDSFLPLLEFLCDNPHVGIVQGTMNIPPDNILDDCGVEMTVFGIQRHLYRGKPTATTALRPRKVFAAKGAMLMFKRQVTDDLGFLFYDDFKSYYEETDFCHRARNRGWQTCFVPTLPIDHLCGATSGKFPREEIWAQYFRNIIVSFWRNYGLFGRCFTLPCFMVAAFCRAPRALVAALRKLSSPDSI